MRRVELALTSLADAGPGSGAKAASLGDLIRRGYSVPDGFVLSSDDVLAAHQSTAAGQRIRTDIGVQLRLWGGCLVAVRSSASGEDSATASHAGQFESVLGVRGVDGVLEAARRCLERAGNPAVATYRERFKLPAAVEMSLIVQVLVDADCAGVLFACDPLTGAAETVINAAWGLGAAVASGLTDPDTVRVRRGAITTVIGSKTLRLDAGGGVARRAVPSVQALQPCLEEGQIRELASLGQHIAQDRDSSQDIEWVIARGRIWILQARPVTGTTATVDEAGDKYRSDNLLNGVGASPGIARGTARTVRGPDEFPAINPGDVLVCRTTDPAWTPLFGLAAAIVTETGGILSHAAIVAREYGIPAVLGVAGALARITDGTTLVVDGTHGTVRETPADPGATP